MLLRFRSGVPSRLSPLPSSPLPPFASLSRARSLLMRHSSHLSILKVDALYSPTLDHVLAIEEEAFPECERLGASLLQYHAKLRTSGLLLARLEGSVAGYLLFSRSAEAGVIAKVAVASTYQRRGVGSSLLEQVRIAIHWCGEAAAHLPTLLWYGMAYIPVGI